MGYSARRKLYQTIEKDRNARVPSFVTGTHPGLEIQIANDCIERFVELLDKIGPTDRISIILHTNGGLILKDPVQYSLLRSSIEETDKHFLFVTEGVVQAVQTSTGETSIENQIAFEGWGAS